MLNNDIFLLKEQHIFIDQNTYCG